MFKQVIKIRLINGANPLEVKKKGDWIDLRANEMLVTKEPKSTKNGLIFNEYLIPLGVAMKLPAGYEAIIVPRSSTFKTYGLIQWNSVGVIDNSYCGSDDEWKFGGIAIRNGEVGRGDRICQFRIQPSQKATCWQRLKWLLSGGKIRFKYVNELSSSNRKGFGMGTGAR